jgi:hypothetical protein
VTECKFGCGRKANGTSLAAMKLLQNHERNCSKRPGGRLDPKKPRKAEVVG